MVSFVGLPIIVSWLKHFKEFRQSLDDPEPVQSVQSYAKGVLMGLSVLHRNGLVHKDLRRSNILSLWGADEGEVVIIDLEHVSVANKLWDHPLLTDWDSKTLNEVQLMDLDDPIPVSWFSKHLHFLLATKERTAFQSWTCFRKMSATR